MKRTELARSQFFRTEVQVKQCAAPKCRKGFIPERMGQEVCSWECAKRYAAVLRKAKKAAEKEQDKARRMELETIPELIEAAQREFNKFIRYRDREQPCICCGEPLGSGEVGGSYDCGHYRSRGSASHLRFDERNAHAQRKYCNRHGAGRAVDYRIGLIERIGLASVEALEQDNRVHHWTREELREIRDKYRAKAKELEKQRDA